MKKKDLERQRKADLKDSIAQSGLSRTEFKSQFDLSGFGGHELLDRTHLLSTMVEQFLLSHPAALLNPDLYQQAAKASRALEKLYQLVGTTSR